MTDQVLLTKINERLETIAKVKGMGYAKILCSTVSLIVANIPDLDPGKANKLAMQLAEGLEMINPSIKAREFFMDVHAMVDEQIVHLIKTGLEQRDGPSSA